ncbi:hypothetical protein [Leptothrix discophora]|uniref:Uncharacterized protein n=1 Tax=Leptothrix discophora TaxID=89 RepID=A0ABT9G372_LEPDI|nr:hypothetical protein [Leptothrix discophora]MDP4300944.1 hypothetical protein [Leptothrix discophora]
MKVDKFGAGLIGAILLLVGLAVLFTDLDPLVLCFKQCDIPRALAGLLGPGLLKILTGGFFVVLAALFLVPLISRIKGSKRLD